MIPTQLPPSILRVCEMCESIWPSRKTSKAFWFFLLVPFFFAFLFSLVVFSPLDRFVDKSAGKTRLFFSFVTSPLHAVGGLARAIIQSRELEAAGISAGCRPSWWGCKDGEGRYSLSRDKANAIFSCRGDGAIFCACCVIWSRSIASSRTKSDLTSSPST